MSYKKQATTLVITIIMAICLLSTIVLANNKTTFPDMPQKDTWSYDAMIAAVNNGLLEGNEGKITPEDNLTRSQMATIMNRAYGAEVKADIGSYTDITATDWYYDEMAKGVQMKMFRGNGDNTLTPNNSITRQEAFTIIARALSLPASDESALKDIKDKNNIAEWARGDLATMVKEGYIKGYTDKTLNPTGFISRQEFAQVMYNTFNSYITKSEDISKEVKGNTVIKADNVILKDVNVKGDLIISEGVKDGSVKLENVALEGRLIVRGGGDNAVKLDNSIINEFIAAKSFNGVLGIVKTDDSEIKRITITDSVDGVSLKDNYDKIEVADKTNISKLILSKTATIEELNIVESSTTLVEGIVNKINLANNIKTRIILADEDADVTINTENYDDVKVTTTDDKPIQLVDGKPIGSAYTANITQTNINYSDTTISLNSYAQLLDLGVNTATVTAKMYYGDQVANEISNTFDIKRDGNANLEKSTWTANMDFKNFGKYEVTIELKNDTQVIDSKTQTVGIVAEEYNLAALNASFPVTYFSISLCDITKTDDGKPIPTMVFLERNAAYNWDNLPENVYSLPTAPPTEDFHKQVAKMIAYVQDLYEMNPDSKFNLYCVDNYPELILKILTANGIPENQYTATLLSDGSGTYYFFNNTFNVTDPQTKYNEMAAEWKQMKKTVAETKVFDGKTVKYADNDYVQILQRYPYIIANEDDNINWWIARKNDTLNVSDAEFLAAVKTSPSIIEKQLNKMLEKLQSKGDYAIAEFKALYNFSDDMFSQAAQEEKKVMMFLGAKITNELNFADYSSFAMDYYGDDYIYYYKGHPGTPTGMFPEKQQQLKDLGITDVESSIAAELILFFYPDIYMGGYASTTFQSVQPEQAGGLFGETKAIAYNDPGKKSYVEYLRYFISPLTSDDATYGSLCTEGKTCYLVEFNDTSKYDIAIWNATDKITTYYKNTDGEFTEVTLPTV